VKQYLEEGLENYRAMIANERLMSSVESAIAVITESLSRGKPLLVCGNGGSASDALHISGELVGRFNLTRSGLNVICLNSNVTVLTAWANDIDYASVFSRQVEAHGSSGAVLWGLSTSGSSENVVKAFIAARELGITTVAQTGQTGGKLARLSDVLINVPATSAARVQELHIPIYHHICEQVEKCMA